ncbi:hypothetical protein QF015_002730 [Paenarthrobacter sp. TE4293]|uniref:hypothetical protein n=1 Tax=unclassified Paenarthrobacter TaxID=2634190 RepID=UPI00339B7BB5
MPHEINKRRFLTIEQVAEELATTDVQIRAMLKTGQLKGIQIGAATSGASDDKTLKTSSKTPTDKSANESLRR